MSRAERLNGAIFLFDGDCAFCTASADLLRRRVPTPVPIEPWQFTDLGALGLTREACERAVQWVGPRHARAVPAHAEAVAAIAALLATSTQPWWRWIGRVLGWVPVRALAGPVYRWVARHRHQLPGGTAACAVPYKATTVGDS